MMCPRPRRRFYEQLQSGGYSGLDLTEHTFAYYGRRMYRFVLRDTDMNDLGDVLLANRVWGLGDVFTTGDRRKYRIYDMLEPPEQE
jgi:hypothetical protein